MPSRSVATATPITVHMFVLDISAFTHFSQGQLSYFKKHCIFLTNTFEGGIRVAVVHNVLVLEENHSFLF